MKRRIFLLSGLLAMMSRHALAKLQPTPSQAEGPFYPVDPIPLRNDLIHHAGSTAAGEQLELSGQIKNSNGQPLNKALIEIWQCDATGRYRHPRASGNDLVDKHFAGFGAMQTTAAGEYRFGG